MSQRPETGPMRFGDDWTGVFIRGDHAAHYAMNLVQILEHVPEGIPKAVISGLMRTLSDSDERIRDEAVSLRLQVLKPWKDCLPPDHRKRQQRTFNARLLDALNLIEHKFVSKNVGRDERGAYVLVGAFLPDGAVDTRKVHAPETFDLWSDETIACVVNAFRRDPQTLVADYLHDVDKPVTFPAIVQATGRPDEEVQRSLEHFVKIGVVEQIVGGETTFEWMGQSD